MMNEHIAKLAAASGFDVGIHEGLILGNFSDMHKLDVFAKLIAKDCAWICDTLLDEKVTSEWSRGTHCCASQIRKQYEAHYE